MSKNIKLILIQGIFKLYLGFYMTSDMRNLQRLGAAAQEGRKAGSSLEGKDDKVFRRKREQASSFVLNPGYK